MWKLINGNSLEGLKEIDNDTFDLALIDPPYKDYKSNHRKNKESKLSKGIIQQSQEDQIRTIQECIRVLKPGSAFYVFIDWENAWWVHKHFTSIFRNMIVWDKGNWTAGSLDDSFGYQYEIIFLGVKGKGWNIRGKRLSDIWTIPRPGQNRLHPTEKPIELYKRCIEVATDPGAWVIDPYGGSGSSIEAALELNRNIMVWELDEYYYNKIIHRIGGPANVANGTLLQPQTA